MSNCIQCGSKNPEKTSARGRARKYCSKKCAQNFYIEQGRYNKHKKPGSDWGTLTAMAAAKRKQKVENRKKQFEWYKDNWYTATQVAEKLGITWSAVHARAKVLGVPAKIVGGGESRTAFWDPRDIKKLKYTETPIPEGYITRSEVCTMLDIKKSTFVCGGYNKKIKPDMQWQQTHGMRNTQHLYLKTKIEQFIKDKEDAVEARRLEVKAREQERLNRVAAVEAARVEARARKEAERIEHARIRKEQKAATRERKLAKQRALYPKSTEDWQSVAAHERRLFARFPSMLTRHANNDKESLRHSKAIKLNKKYSRLAKAGILTELTCRTCGVTQPYYEFYYERSDAAGRRTQRCRTCESARSKRRHALEKESWKQRRKENYRGKFRTLVATTIKKDISRARGVYAKDLSAGDIWSMIEKHCGYDLDQFIVHIEKQFDENMHWLNHGRGTDQYYWQIDHIVPRSKFQFTEFDDPAFIACWSLDNMQPLSAYENMIKDNPFTKGINPFTKEKI